MTPRAGDRGTSFERAAAPRRRPGRVDHRADRLRSKDSTRRWSWRVPLHTRSSSRTSAQLTCLVPTRGVGISAPAKVDLKSILVTIEFRYRGRGEALPPRAPPPPREDHVLEGFRKVFNALDEAIRLSGRRTASRDARRSSGRFSDDLQADAILELSLSRSRTSGSRRSSRVKEKKARVAEIEAPSRARGSSKPREDRAREARKFDPRARGSAGGRRRRSTTRRPSSMRMPTSSRDGWSPRGPRGGPLEGAPVPEMSRRGRGEHASFDRLLLSNLGSAHGRIHYPPARRRSHQRFFKFCDGGGLPPPSPRPARPPDIGPAPDPRRSTDEEPVARSATASPSRDGYNRFALHAFAEP
jgi:hypothetical protein